MANAKPQKSMATSHIIGRQAFAAITAVEGLKLTADSEARLRRTEKLSPEERRAETIRAFIASQDS
jgi:hypothetical protein